MQGACQDQSCSNYNWLEENCRRRPGLDAPSGPASCTKMHQRSSMHNNPSRVGALAGDIDGDVGRIERLCVKEAGPAKWRIVWRQLRGERAERRTIEIGAEAGAGPI